MIFLIHTGMTRDVCNIILFKVVIIIMSETINIYAVYLISMDHMSLMRIRVFLKVLDAQSSCNKIDIIVFRSLKL